MSFCKSCGSEVNEKAAVCLKCGVAVHGADNFNLNPENVSDKEWIVAMLLSFFVGSFGVDRFYLGYTGLGIAKLLTFGGCGIWSLIDFILICMGKMTDVNGRPLKK